MFGMLPFIDINALQQFGAVAIDELKEITKFDNIIHAPENPANWPAFRKSLLAWRKEARQQLKYDDRNYSAPAFAWTQSNYSCCFLMMYDLEFFNPIKLEYNIEHLITKGKNEFGGYDSVVLWHAYPRIGIDDRNQFDFYRDMPGGPEGLRKVVQQFHQHQVKVFINYNPWDTGTRREGINDIDALAAMVGSIDADGIFLDTLKNAAFDFRKKLDAIKPGIVLEGELAAELEMLPTHHLSWAQDFMDKYIPGVLRNKWYEPRHLQHQINRWSRDHSSEMHLAWMNGSGMMIWENVFGQWLPWHARDKSILRTMTPIQRRYSSIFNSEGFTPWIETNTDGVFANQWEAPNTRIWTMVNRHEKTVSGTLLTVPHIKGQVYYDLVAGVIAQSRIQGEMVTLCGMIGPRGIGCIIAVNQPGVDFPGFLNFMQTLRQHTDSNIIIDPPALAALRKIKSPAPVQSSPPEGMVEIKPAVFRQTTSIESRECGTYYSSPVVAVDLSKSEVFPRTARITRIAVDVTPVTNKQYSEFLSASDYRPRERTHFLKHWINGNYPAEKHNHPVVYVDLEDARAYARWCGKRLPSEAEWQYAAQGYGWSKYPWGDELKVNCYNNGNDTTPVDAFPAGRSPFGCLDLCGNTWELTESEYSDAHNRFCMLKGGSFYQAKDSHWYTRGGPLPSEVSTKFLMLYPGLDRCGTIGFRCVMDLV
jgi:formylglycine-generating enzyme required for sulfatase activity